jgi:hypothetical protein
MLQGFNCRLPSGGKTLIDNGHCVAMQRIVIEIALFADQ